MKRQTTLLFAGLLACAVPAVHAGQEVAPATRDITTTTQTAESTTDVVVAGDDKVTQQEEKPTSEGSPEEVEVVVVTEEKPGTAKQEKRSVAFTVESSVQSDSKDGKPAEKQFKGRVVVVGPDGERKEYDLSKELPEGIKLFDVQSELLKGAAGSPEEHHKRMKVLIDRLRAGAEGKLKEGFEVHVDEEEATETERLMIGVHCAEADELLRGHLKLGGVGLTVLEVVEGSPAADAGLAENDLLLKVGSTELKTIHDLLKAVRESDGKELTLHLLRSGDPVEIRVTPRAMKEQVRVVVTGPGEVESDGGVFRFNELSLDGDEKKLLFHLQNKAPGIRWNQVYPGIVINRAHGIEQVEEALKAAEEAEAAAGHEARGKAPQKFMIRKTESHDSTDEDGGDLSRDLRKVQQELKALSKRLAELESKK